MSDITLIDKVMLWLDDPQHYLRKQTRRELLEKMIMAHDAKTVAADRRRVTAGRVVMWLGFLTAVLSFIPNILETFGVEIW
tara:strand:- start:327 stop:569 length:243 start_codon:yes stop_codon:yes gene_type:complete